MIVFFSPNFHMLKLYVQIAWADRSVDEKLQVDRQCTSLSTITLQQHAATVNGWCLCCKPISKSVSCQTTTACSSSQWLKSAASQPVKSVPHQTATATSSSQQLKFAANWPVKSVPCQTASATSSSQRLKSAANRPVKSVPHQTATATSSSQQPKSAASPSVRSVPHQTTIATSSGQRLKPGLRVDGPPRPQPATVKLTSVLEVDQQRLPPLHAFVQTHGQVGQRLVVCGLQQLWTNKHTIRISVMFFKILQLRLPVGCSNCGQTSIQSVFWHVFSF